MSAIATQCPPPDQLRKLLANELSLVEADAVTEHLGDCPDCQTILDNLARGGWAYCPLADKHSIPLPPPPPDSAYWPALKAVQNAVAAPARLDATADSPPPDSEAPDLSFLSPSETPGHLGTLGDFEIVSLIGRGGMGMVFKALDTCLEREIAIKVLDPRLGDNPASRKRFCREARLAASLNHENVVGIHFVELLETPKGKLPYLVMQLVQGESLQDRLDRSGPLPLKDIVSIATQAAAGLAAAHARRVVHRDVKPANILLEETKPGHIRVRITDFGLARAAEDVKLTQSGFVAGTPLYMAPEQARGEEVDERTDLFSFGSVLYAMCTGRAPFEGSTPFVVLRGVTEQEPKPIAELNPEIPDWLIGIIAKLHKKSPAERFQSFAELAEILAAHQAMLQPLNTGQLSPALCPKLPPSLSSSPRRPSLGTYVWSSMSAVFAGLWLMALSGSSGSGEIRSAQSQPSNQSVHQAAMTLPGTAGPIWSLAFSPDGKQLASAVDDGQVRLWDTTTSQIITTLPPHRGVVWSLAFDIEGTKLATASDDGMVRVWDVSTQKPVLTQAPLQFGAAVRCLAFAKDGRLVAGGRDGRVRVWEANGEEGFTIDAHRHVVMGVAFTPDGEWIVSAGGDKLAKIWDSKTGQKRLDLAGHTAAIYALSVSSDGQTIATAGWDKSIRLWDAGTGTERRILHGHSGDIWSVAFAPCSSVLASGSEDRTMKFWEVSTGRELGTCVGHTGTIYAVAFSSDCRTFASGSRDGTIKIYHKPNSSP